MSGIEVTTATAPAHWACYLVNDDASGMEEGDILQCDAWVKRLAVDGWRVVSCEGEPWFAHSCDAGWRFNGAIAEYVLHREAGHE